MSECGNYNLVYDKDKGEIFCPKCGICGLTEKENGQRLSVHHVDYEKKSCCEIPVFNSTPNLFIPLCKTHHSKTNSNRKYWEEMFSNYIMTYFDGECFLSKEEADIY
jgi:transcription initiation factor TFIIIB Brf1 subunit/transcription initiation factor TFIIB